MRKLQEIFQEQPPRQSKLSVLFSHEAQGNFMCSFNRYSFSIRQINIHFSRKADDNNKQNRLKTQDYIGNLLVELNINFPDPNYLHIEQIPISPFLIFNKYVP